MTDTAYYLSFVYTAIAASLLFIFMRRRILKSITKESKGRNLYFFAMPLVGFGSGALLFPATVWLFRTSGIPSGYGHGEALIAAPLFNFVFASVLGAAGHALLGWRSVKW